MNKTTKDKLDKIINLLEEIKANQPMVLYPPVYIPSCPQQWPDPRPYVPPYPNCDPYYPNWTSPQDGTTLIPVDGIYQC